MDIATALSRRRFFGCGLAGLASVTLAAQFKPAAGGLQVGLQTYSLRGIRYPALVAAVRQTGIRECELFAPQLEPAEAPDLWAWRDTVSLDYYKAIRKQFNQAGITIVTYYPSWAARGRGRGRRGVRGPRPGGRLGPRPGGRLGMRPGASPPGRAPAPPVTDAQLERVFACAQALGVTSVNAQMPLEIATRVAPLAQRYRMITAVESVNPSLLTQVAALSPWMRISVDIGDFTRAGLDARQFVKDHYGQLLEVHLKDCKFRGASVPFGEGDAHMAEIVRFLAGQRGAVRANIDCDYPGTGTSVEEVRRCYQYVESCLA